MTMTKQDRVLKALKAGQELTAKQIEARFGVGNARATLSDLRSKGFAIRTVAVEGKNAKYRLSAGRKAR